MPICTLRRLSIPLDVDNTAGSTGIRVESLEKNMKNDIRKRRVTLFRGFAISRRQFFAARPLR
jgi:hypothetical protein